MSVSIIQAKAANQGGGGGTFGITLAAIAAGSAVVVFAGGGGGFTSAPGCSDGTNALSVTWDDHNAPISPCACFCRYYPTGGFTTFSVTNSGKLSLMAVEIAGLFTTPVDVAASVVNGNQAATTNPTSGNVTTTGTNGGIALGFTFFGNANLAGNLSAGAGWSALSGTGFTLGENDNATAGCSAFGMFKLLGGITTLQANTPYAGTAATGFDTGIIVLSAPVVVAPPLPLGGKSIFIMP